jgi:hypothetical protein
MSGSLDFDLKITDENGKGWYITIFLHFAQF